MEQEEIREVASKLLKRMKDYNSIDIASFRSDRGMKSKSIPFIVALLLVALVTCGYFMFPVNLRFGPQRELTFSLYRELAKLLNAGASAKEFSAAVQSENVPAEEIRIGGASLLELVIGRGRADLIEPLVELGCSVDGSDGLGRPLRVAIFVDCETCVLGRV